MNQKKTVLLVDDSSLSRSMIKKTLLEDDFSAENIEEAPTGRHALDKIVLANGRGQDYSYIFLDLNMPEMSGMELLKKIKEEKNIILSSKIIVVSSESEPSTVLQAMSLGAHACVSKPPKKEDIINKLAS